MNQLSSTTIPQKLPIAYAGITAECIPGTKNIYEIVWNCGSLTGLMLSLSDPDSQYGSLRMIADILENIQSSNRQVIFITDQGIFDKNEEILRSLFTSIFGVGNFYIKWVVTTSQEKNSINGLRVNKTWFTSTRELVAMMTELPDAITLSSIPRSDPRIDDIIDQIPTESILRQSFAFKALGLLALNAKKSNQETIWWSAMWYIGRANSMEELAQLFQDTQDQRLVLKEDAWSAGGTSVNFVGNPEQRSLILRSAPSFPLLVFSFMEPTLVRSRQNWWVYSAQFRPFFMNDGSFWWGCFKIPNEPIPTTGFLTWWGKWVFAKQNRSLNTSSWLCNSFFVDASGNWVTGQIVTEQGFQTIDAWGISDHFQNFALDKSNKKIWFDEFLNWASDSRDLIRDIQVQTNRTLWLI